VKLLVAVFRGYLSIFELLLRHGAHIAFQVAHIIENPFLWPMNLDPAEFLGQLPTSRGSPLDGAKPDHLQGLGQAPYQKSVCDAAVQEVDSEAAASLVPYSRPIRG
jgi:hypothetical protein